MIRPMNLNLPTKILLIAGYLVATNSCKRRQDIACPASLSLSAKEISGASLTVNQLSLSFDSLDGSAWQDISQLLIANGIEATYFASGQQLETYQERAKFLLSQRHLVGIKGWTGGALSQSADPVGEVRRADFALKSIWPDRGSLLLRSSGGWNQSVADELNASGLGRYVGPIGMDLGWTTQGFEDDQVCWNNNISVDQCSQKILSRIRVSNHGILNFRSLSTQSLQLLQLVIPQLRTDGFKFVRIDLIPEISTQLSRQSALGITSQCDDYK